MQPKLLTTADLFPDQARAVQTIMQFVEDPNCMEMLVEGPAGSGKTSTIRVGLQMLDEDSLGGVVVCAPTNKAVKVARELSGGMVETTTIYKLLSLSPQANGEIKEIKQGEAVHKKLLACDLVVLDEASMASEPLRPFILAAQLEYGIKFIYLGDRYQAPPVGEQLSWVFKQSQLHCVLDKVKRHDNAILNLATHLREVIDNGGKGLKIQDDWTEADGGVEVFTRGKAFDAAIIDCWNAAIERKETDFSANRILAWRNARVNSYNELVRELIYGRKEARNSPLAIGERVVVCNPVMSLQEAGVTMMHTDEEGFVERIDVCTHPDYEDIECYRLVVKRESDGKRVGLLTPTEAGWRAANRALNQFKKKAQTEDRIYWGAFWNLKEKMNDVRPCHALTVHRSQGSTFREVFVDLDDIMSSPEKIEALKLAYVAITRASHKVNVKWSGR